MPLSVVGRIAPRERAGLRVRRIGGSFGYEGEKPLMRGYLYASMSGFSIHGATSIKNHDRIGLQKHIRYMGHGAISQERISLNDKGEILYELKNSYDGATHVLFSQVELMEKLSGIIPPPYRYGVNYYGCLSSRSSLRPLIYFSGRETEKG